MKLRFQFYDGTETECEVANLDEAWETVREMEHADKIANAWRDGLPWFGSWEP